MSNHDLNKNTALPNNATSTQNGITYSFVEQDMDKLKNTILKRYKVLHHIPVEQRVGQMEHILDLCLFHIEQAMGKKNKSVAIDRSVLESIDQSVAAIGDDTIDKALHELNTYL